MINIYAKHLNYFYPTHIALIIIILNFKLQTQNYNKDVLLPSQNLGVFNLNLFYNSLIVIYKFIIG